MGAQALNLIGQRFGRLVVIAKDEAKSTLKSYWVCKCDCGAEKSIRGISLVKATRSCGCLSKEYEDFSEQQFGSWTAIRRTRGKPNALWECRCVCGTISEVARNSLVAGTSTSCGCVRISKATTHGHNKRGKRSSEYTSWRDMLRRCCDTTHPKYKDYGGRGIAVCQEWRESFEAFLRDMRYKPTPKHTTHRFDNDRNYEPSNCSWATKLQQARHTRRSLMITFNDKTQCASAWAEELGISPIMLYNRIRDHGVESAVAMLFKPASKETLS